jgi:hypothetical protein
MVEILSILAAIFQAQLLARGAAGLLGIVEPDSTKIKKLVAKDFEVGVRHLRDLLEARQNQDYLLRQAWQCFAGAAEMESGTRKARAYIALAFCQYRLGETKLAISTLCELTSYDYVDRGARNKKRLTILGALALDIITVPIFTIFVPMVTAAALLVSKERAENLATLASITNAASEWMNSAPSEKQVELLKKEAKNLIPILEAEL